MKQSYKEKRDIKISYPNSVVVTYSWSMVSHGICGHNFEAFELAVNFKQNNIPVTYLIPDTDIVAQNVRQALESKYKDTEQIEIIQGKPSILVGGMVILCDGVLPTKGVIHANKLVMVLCNKDFWWAKNIKMFTGTNLELWYDSRLGYNVEELVKTLKSHSPKLNIVLQDTYIKKINFKLYRSVSPEKRTRIHPGYHTYLVYTTGNCRDIFLADDKYGTDTLKEIKSIIAGTHLNIPMMNKKLIVLGWNPNYSPYEKMIFNKSKDQKLFSDRRLASIYANDTSEYFGIDVEVIPECDLPLDNIMEEFDTYIYTPTSKNWDCSSRLIPECKYFKKEVILSPTTKVLLDNNLGLKIRIQDYCHELLNK